MDEEYDFMTDKELLREAVELWGQDAQLFIVAEELAELIQAISKWKRYGTDKEKKWVTDEIADVFLMIMQVIFMLDINMENIRESIYLKQEIIREKVQNAKKNMENN